MTRGSTVIPLLRYRDAPAAIEWLCRVFGFERRVVVPGPGSEIRHAQLTLGGGMLMLGSVRAGEDAGPQRLCLVVTDADAACARARAAGARIDLEPQDADFGGRLFSCRDPEGHVWNVGTYDPWA